MTSHKLFSLITQYVVFKLSGSSLKICTDLPSKHPQHLMALCLGTLHVAIKNCCLFVKLSAKTLTNQKSSILYTSSYVWAPKFNIKKKLIQKVPRSISALESPSFFWNAFTLLSHFVLIDTQIQRRLTTCISHCVSHWGPANILWHPQTVI